jgi:hypothetical protein
MIDESRRNVSAYHSGNRVVITFINHFDQKIKNLTTLVLHHIMLIV